MLGKRNSPHQLLIGDGDSRVQTCLVPAVVPSARQSFRVLIGQHRAIRLHHCQRSEILGTNDGQVTPSAFPIPTDRDNQSSAAYLGGDELEAGELPPRLVFDDFGNLWVGLGKGSV